ncbi:MAG TPA: 50S ribosomal protein L21 [Elusimicrobiota bacterium]|nr:50S ribosomal protein L21 [Elusimicrobiota bacterium]
METASYAIIKTGGKQYRVSAGLKIKFHRLPQQSGEEVVFPDVLFIKDGEEVQTGRPSVAGVTVVGEVLRHGRAKKILIFKKRSKKGYKKMQGHRQDFTEVLIKNIAKNS